MAPTVSARGRPTPPWVASCAAPGTGAAARVGRSLYSRDEYERFFAAAGLEVEFKRVNLASGMKYYFNSMFNGLTHARYALVARKPVRPAAKVDTKPISTRRSR